MDFRETDPVQARQIQIEIIKLTAGERVIRLSEPDSGLAIERRLNPKEPVARQKQRLQSAFEAARARCDIAEA